MERWVSWSLLTTKIRIQGNGTSGKSEPGDDEKVKSGE